MLRERFTYIEKNNSLIISHFDKSADENFTFSEYLKIAKTKHLWIDIKNNFNLEICKNLKQTLYNNLTDSNFILK